MNEIQTLPVCARGHSLRSHVLDDGSETPAVAERGRLCEDCYRRLEWQLDDAPGIIQRARAAVVPGVRAAGGSTPVSGTKEVPLPFDAGALADADDLFAELANWATAAARSLQLEPPAELAGVFALDANVQGLAADASPAAAGDTAEGVARWLLEHLEAIAASPMVVDVFDGLVPAVEHARGRWGSLEPKVRRSSRPCLACGDEMVRVAWDGQRPLMWCRRCLLPQPIDWTVLT